MERAALRRWGRGFELAVGENEPGIRDEVLHLPASADAELYRAAATHAADHLMYQARVSRPTAFARDSSPRSP